jgi:hypothetical protein
MVPGSGPADFDDWELGQAMRANAAVAARGAAPLSGNPSLDASYRFGQLGSGTFGLHQPTFVTPTGLAERDASSRILGENWDGPPAHDGTPSRGLTDSDVAQIYASVALARNHRVTQVFDQSDPRQQFIAILADGTRNSLNQRPFLTNVGELRDRFQALADNLPGRIGIVYGQGPGTQEGILRETLDSASGYSVGLRAHGLLREISDEVGTRLAEDPNANIMFGIFAFSRGVGVAHALGHLLETHGVPDFRTEYFESWREGADAFVPKYSHYYIKPGEVKIGAYGAFDAVRTGVSQLEHSEAPASAVNRWHITAENEHRYSFPLSDFDALRIRLPGSHSDIGNSYDRGGIGDLSLDIMTHLIRGAGVPIEGNGMMDRLPLHAMRVHDSRWTATRILNAVWPSSERRVLHDGGR